MQRLVNIEIDGILRMSSKLTATMPMRHAYMAHDANITGQLRQVTLGSVGHAGIRSHPDACLFLSADFNPDDDDNQDDCNHNTHRLSPPFPAFPRRGLRPMTQRHPAVSAPNILPGDGLVKSNRQNNISSIIYHIFMGVHENFRLI